MTSKQANSHQKDDQPSLFTRSARELYHPLGFKEGYNFVLFFIFAGALLGFTLARFQFLDIDGVLCNRNDGGTMSKAYGDL
jgi:hypothetical protein